MGWKFKFILAYCLPIVNFEVGGGKVKTEPIIIDLHGEKAPSRVTLRKDDERSIFLQIEETEIKNEEEVTQSVSTPKTQNDQGGSIQTETEASKTGEKLGCDADSEEFERLIKGPYKEAFAARVQGIINKRFKEIKKSEASAEGEKKVKSIVQPKSDEASSDKADNTALSLRAAEIVAMGYTDFDLEKELENPTFKALLDGGVDMLTAYQTLHIDQIMDGSVKYGAEAAAKQMADSIRFKAGRPSENGLNTTSGYGTRGAVSSLTPKKRRELARKALMGEKITF